VSCAAGGAHAGGRRRFLGLTALALWPPALVPAQAAAAQPLRHTGFADALGRAAPASFGVYGLDPQQAPGSVAAASSGRFWRVGAGFFIDAQGLGVTAAHVVEGCRQVAVKLSDGRVETADVLAADEASDVAVLRLPTTLAVPPALGRAAALRPGDWVIAIGEPFGLGGSAVAGIVGGKNRHFADDPAMTYIQSDLAMNPGNSGGPLLDADGVIVGMNVRTVVGQPGSGGLSLSIPIELVLQIARELQHGPIVRPELGLEFHDLTPVEALALGRRMVNGARIELVRAGSLADDAGLAAGDLVLGFDGRPIDSSADLAVALLAWRAARATRVAVYRDGGFREVVLPARAVRPPR
jgi:serine protease Do